MSSLSITFPALRIMNLKKNFKILFISLRARKRKSAHGRQGLGQRGRGQRKGKGENLQQTL